jgi:hypothetical protein
MSEYPITLAQGDNAGYSLILTRKNTTTDITNVNDSNVQIEKVIFDGKLMILHNGNVYDATGALVK